jgi:hypothetical protein
MGKRATCAARLLTCFHILSTRCDENANGGFPLVHRKESRHESEANPSREALQHIQAARPKPQQALAAISGDAPSTHALQLGMGQVMSASRSLKRAMSTISGCAGSQRGLESWQRNKSRRPALPRARETNARAPRRITQNPCDLAIQMR